MKLLSIYQDQNGKYYQAYSERPLEVTQQSVDGKFYRNEFVEAADGSKIRNQFLVCEDCWRDIPKYIDFPRGLVSPESDGDRGGNFPKHRQVAPPAPVQNPNAMATEALQKTVCRECYLEAFARFNPGIKPPALRPDVYEIKDFARIEKPVEEVQIAMEPRV